MSTTIIQQKIRPMESRSRIFTVLALLSGAGVAVWLYYCFRLLTEGHRILSTDSYGAVWGITVANIVHVIGISHVGIAVSATVRVLRLEAYRNLARVAEIVTLIALFTAILNIAVDVGRPDRFITHTVHYGRWQAPMVWSLTVIVTYFLASFVYLYLSMRPDFSFLARTGLRSPRLFRVLALGYRDTLDERSRHARTLFWMAILLIPIMVSVHSVYGLIFGLMAAKPGWFNPLQAPYFVLGAVVSGFAAIVFIAALLRHSYEWKDLLPDQMFRATGGFLAFVVFLYLYFLFSEHLTAQYSNLPVERAVSDALLFGEYEVVFWLTVIAGLVIPFAFLLLQAVRGSVRLGLTTTAALAIGMAMWAKRFLLIVPAQFRPHLPTPRALIAYSPTLAEMILTFGTYAVALLAFLFALRLVPVMELDPRRPVLVPVPSTQDGGVSALRTAIMTATLITGAFLIAWGIGASNEAFAPLKWLAGVALLTALPLEYCLIKDSLERPAEQS